jgi:hypothetical protein
MKTRHADRSASPPAQGLTRVTVGARTSALDLLAARVLLKRRGRAQIPKDHRAAGAANRSQAAVADQRAVERARALLGCAVRGIRPPGAW